MSNRKNLKAAGWTVRTSNRNGLVTSEWMAVASRATPRVMVVSATGKTQPEALANLVEEVAKVVK